MAWQTEQLTAVYAVHLPQRHRQHSALNSAMDSTYGDSVTPPGSLPVRSPKQLTGLLGMIPGEVACSMWSIHLCCSMRYAVQTQCEMQRPGGCDK